MLLIAAAGVFVFFYSNDETRRVNSAANASTALAGELAQLNVVDSLKVGGTVSLPSDSGGSISDKVVAAQTIFARYSSLEEEYASSDLVLLTGVFGAFAIGISGVLSLIALRWERKGKLINSPRRQSGPPKSVETGLGRHPAQTAQRVASMTLGI